MQQLFRPVMSQSRALKAAGAGFGSAQTPDAAMLAACGNILHVCMDLCKRPFHTDLSDQPSIHQDACVQVSCLYA